jgi:IclR family transcriptional regulator, KDG regulon repressor
MLRNAMAVLDLFTMRQREIGVLEAADLLDRPKSTVSRWLSAMEAAGFLERDGVTGRYRVSLRLAAVGELARQATSLQQVAYPALQRLTAVTGETSNLVLLVGTEGMNVEAVESPKPVIGLGAVGRRFPLHASAAGKALAAWRPESEIRALVPQPLSEHTPRTITDFAAFLKDLAEVRARGYALNLRELEEDLVGVGAPVRNHRGEVVASLSISAPPFRATRAALPRLGKHVSAAADSLSATLGYRANAIAVDEAFDLAVDTRDRAGRRRPRTG